MMKAFARAFFEYHAARIEEQPDELIIDLPPNLVDIFGRACLYLVFPSGPEAGRELSPHEDLLVYGSRTFDLMLTLLAEQGETARLHYPLQLSAELSHLPQPTLRHPRWHVTEQQVTRRQDQFFIFNFRAEYVSDEKQEAFLTTVLDTEGQPAPATQKLLAGITPLPEPPASLPALTPDSLSKLLQQATDITQKNVKQQTDQLEATAKKRLERVLLRLTSYYRHRIEDIDTGDIDHDAQLRTELQRDLDRKVSDELERHRLRVTLSPISHATALLPAVHYRLAITTNPAAALKQIQPLTCRPCPQAVPPVTPPAGLTLNRYRWSQAEGEEYVIYLGHHFLWGMLIMVANNAGQVVFWQHTGWKERLFHRGNKTVNHPG